MNPFNVKLHVFREILVLPLRLTKLDGKMDWREFLSGPICREWQPVENIAPKTTAYDPATFQFNKDDPDAPLEDHASSQKRWRFAEQAYFHPSVQKFLYDGHACKTFEKKEPPKTIRVEAKYGMTSPAGDAFVIDLAVDSCRLTFVPEPGLALLTLEVHATAETPVLRFTAKDKNKHKVADRQKADEEQNDKEKKQRQPLTLADALTLHDTLRRIFPPFFLLLPGEQWKTKPARHDEALFARHVELYPAGSLAPKESDPEFSSLIDGLNLGTAMPYAPWWHELLEPLVQDNLFTQVVDDRMPSMVFVGLPAPAQISEANLIRLCFADHAGTGMPYDPGFMKDFKAKHAYTRFSHWGTTYFASAYSFVCVAGTGDRSWSEFSDARDVLQEHFRRHYAKMFFIVQMQKAALLAFSAYLADAVALKAHERTYLEQIRRVRGALVSFTHRFWFSNVSNQEQARELFEKMQSLSGNPALHAEVMAESEAARQELAICAAESQAESGVIFNLLIAVATTMGLPLAYFGTKYAEGYCHWLHPVMAVSALLAAVIVFFIVRHHEAAGLRKPLAHAGYVICGLCVFACLVLGAAAMKDFPPVSCQSEKAPTGQAAAAPEKPNCACK